MKHSTTYRLALCLTTLFVALITTATMTSCARMGQPDERAFDRLESLCVEHIA